MQTAEALKAYMMALPGTTEETPFGPEALVYKVLGKMYALVSWTDDPLSISLKCDPDQALFLRDMYPAVTPAPYMSEKHWNNVTLDGTVGDAEVRSMIDDSYDLVVRKNLTKAQRAELGFRES